MVAFTRQPNSEIVEQAQVRALEGMLGVLCEYLSGLVDRSLPREELETREARFQLEAFEERRRRALEYLDAGQDGPLVVKIGNLERLVEALECSWVYFNGLAETAGIFEDTSDWSVCVK